MAGRDCFKKAELIAEGVISIPKGVTLPYFPSRSDSGPDAGSHSIVIGFDGCRLKTPISRGPHSRFSLDKIDQGYIILKDSEPYIRDVNLIPCHFHAPRQAFIDLTGDCDFNCAFCSARGSRRRGIPGKLERALDRVIR